MQVKPDKASLKLMLFYEQVTVDSPVVGVIQLLQDVKIKVFANLTTPWIIAHSPRPKNDIMALSKCWIDHLKGLFLSFQKIIKF